MYRAGLPEFLPFLKLENTNGTTAMSGPLAEAFTMIAQKANLTLTLYREPQDNWGMKGPYGWTGLLGMLSRNEVDFALGPFTLTYSRWKDFEMSVPLYTDTVEILAPSFEWKMSLFHLLAGFTHGVWFLLFITVVVLCLIEGYIVSYDNPSRKFKRGFFISVWNVTSTLLQKGRLKRPDGYLLTLLSVTWMLSAILISLFFSAMLLTNIVVKKEQVIDSIEDLDASKSVQPVLEHHSSVHATFKDGTLEVYRSIISRIETNPTESILSYKNLSTVGMDCVFRGRHALITDGMILRSFLLERIEKGLPCNYRLSKEYLWPMWKVLAFRPGFPKDTKLKINRIIRFIFESGWLKAAMMRKFSGYSECLRSSTVEVQSLKLEHFKGTFIIWFIGCLVSAIAFFLEHFFKEKDSTENQVVIKRRETSMDDMGVLKRVKCKRTKFEPQIIVLKEVIP